jgi:adenylate cyclase
MDLLSRIAGWLGENEATISAVVGITVLTGIVFAGVRWLILRGTARASEKPLVRPSRRTILIAASAAVLLVLAAVTAWLILPDSSTRELAAGVEPEASRATGAAPLGDEEFTVPGFGGVPAIAVLAFDNLSGDPEQEYFADGIAEDLITRLSAWRVFPVIARNSSFTYKGKPVDVKRVSQELGARYVVEGSVRKVGDRVRITAQLIDATTGAHVWAEQYDRALEDVLATQDEITMEIAGAMGAELTAVESERAAQQQTQSLTAYDLFMRGRWYDLRAWTVEDPRSAQFAHSEARSLLKQAIDIDPMYAVAFAWLAYTYQLDYYFRTLDPAEALEGMERAARKSVLLDPELPIGHVVLGQLHQIRHQPDQAVAAVRHAIELDPSSPDAYRQLGFILAEGGEPEEAIAVFDNAMRLSPRDPWLAEFLRGKSHAHFAAGRYVEAVEYARQSIAHGAPLSMAWLVLAASQAHLEEIEEAKAALREAEARTGWTETAAEFRRVHSYFHPDFLERYIDGLRKAGLPK